MRHVKLIINGEFWDSQIYTDRLLLLDDHGAIHDLDWRSLINNISKKHFGSFTAIKVAFLESDLFYRTDIRTILEDKNIALVIKKEFELLSKEPIELSKFEIKQDCRTKDSPFNFAPIDTDIYYGRLFASGDEGLYSIPYQSNDKKIIKHHFDGSVFQIKASDNYTSLIAATGNDGLMEFEYVNLTAHPLKEQILSKEKKISKSFCNSCDWAFQSVIGWSYEEAFFSNYKKEKDAKGKIHRIYDKTLNMNDVFKTSNSYFWGSHEKIYCINKDSISIWNYNPESENANQNELFDKKGVLLNNFDSNKIISTGTAPFGTVIELTDKIIVTRSDGKIEEFDGEAVHWRCFPRSSKYSNHLHIIYEDRIEIISFVHDYFVDQPQKMFGFLRNCTPLNNDQIFLHNNEDHL